MELFKSQPNLRQEQLNVLAKRMEYLSHLTELTDLQKKELKDIENELAHRGFNKDKIIPL